jgi:multiple antibiotic resistance protein
MSEVTNAFLLIYAGLLPIVNPLGSAPLFLGLTHRCSDNERRQLARSIAWNSLFLLLGSLLAGSYILEFFGITLPALRVAGGLVVMAFGWKMLHAPSTPAEQAAAGPSNGATAANSFYPLTIPLTVGPGSISVAVALGSQRPPLEPEFARFFLVGAGAITGLIAIAVTVWVCYRFAGRIVRALGKQGSDVLMRLSAFILICIGVQIAWNGISALVASVR